MAGRMLGMTNGDAQIKGNCQATGFTDFLVLDHAAFAATASLSPQEQTGDVYQSGVSVMVQTGPWIAELEQAMYGGKNLGTVTISELAQVTDNANNKTWKKVREVALTQAWIETIQVDMQGITTSCML